jgi:hypothetical protein
MTSATGTPVSAPASFARIESRILFMRGHRVMIDADLAALYGVPTKALNQAVKRNAGRFPQDFMFQLTPEEKREVVTNCGHLASLKFSKALPLAFTEHGAIQAANVLNSVQAVDMGGVRRARLRTAARDDRIQHGIGVTFERTRKQGRSDVGAARYPCSQYPRRIGAAVRGDPAFDGATANCQEAAYGIRNAGEEASQNEDEVI